MRLIDSRFFSVAFNDGHNILAVDDYLLFCEARHVHVDDVLVASNYISGREEAVRSCLGKDRGAIVDQTMMSPEESMDT